jgi:DNA replication protein DnaC
MDTTSGDAMTVNRYENPFASLLGDEPEWLTCKCGALTSRTPCWDCERIAIATADAVRNRDRALATIPRRFDWANTRSPELAERVKCKQPLSAVVERALASTRVVFAGPSGSGKTSLACACLRERVPHGEFISATSLGTARIQHSAGDGEAALVERAMTVPLLLLDEVGGEMKTATNAVRDVVFARYDADLPTWITTGFKLSELAAMYGDGASRRLTEGVFIVRLGDK